LTIRRIIGVSDDTQGGYAMPWQLTGNAGTTAADFLGTTDNKPLVIKTDNAPAIQINPNGQVGVGTSMIYHTLQVGGGYDGNLGFDGSDGTPNAGYLRFGDSTGWQFHITRQREKGGGAPLNTGTTGVLVTIQDNGNVNMTGSLNVGGDITMPASDFAEDFHVAGDAIEPGTVMVLNENGALRESNTGYDRRVAGVISGAGDYRPGLILDRQRSSAGRLPLALVGKVYCKVDAAYGPIEVGDLLTTSPTPGHAMKASDPLKAFGAVIGKALRPLESGAGLIPILVALQ
jgi:hypothetical protein